LSDDQTPRGLLAPRQPIERRNTYELVAESLLALISERHLKPGDSLPTERELMEHYGVGRSSVREALRMLESKGLIAGGSGAFTVADFRNPLNDSLSLLLAVEEGSLRELFEVRRILEGEAVALATERCDESHLARMRAATELMREGLADQAEYIESDVAFHLTIAEATQNRLILHLMHAIRDQLERALGSIYRIPGSPEASIDDHGLIIAAMGEGRPEDARARMREHLERVEEAVDAATAKSKSKSSKSRRG
jgi:GntR family transcriptional repressor for pyruvate dehydrogenase complex